MGADCGCSNSYQNEIWLADEIAKLVEHLAMPKNYRPARVACRPTSPRLPIVSVVGGDDKCATTSSERLTPVHRS